MQSYLIVGGTKEERFKKALQMANKWQIENLDKIILEAENSIGIDDIRNLQHRLSLKPYSSSYKIAILTSAEKLTIPAQNAFLKTLEEPPQNTIIILTSPGPDFLLPTIISRCRIIRLPNKSQIKLSQEERTFVTRLLASILKIGVGERIKMANEIAKNRQEAIKFCQAQLIIWREKTIKASSIKRQASSVKVIRQIQKTLKMLEANVNPKLAMENLLLEF